MMRGKPAVLAVVFDFDETLVPDSTSKLLQSPGVDPHEFWTEHVRRRLERVHGTIRRWQPGRSLSFHEVAVEAVGGGTGQDTPGDRLRVRSSR